MTIKFNISELEQKDLYFKLKQIFNIEKNDVNSMYGIYAIFKNGYCVYVGQSKNMASRIATHVFGKYKNADFVLIYNVEDLGFYDFHKRSSESMIKILNNCENYIISNLKPTENIIADFSFKLKHENTPDFDFRCFNFCLDLRAMDVGDIIVSDSGSEIVIGSDYFEYLYVTNKKLTKREAELLKLFDDMLFSETVDSIISNIELG